MPVKFQKCVMTLKVIRSSELNHLIKDPYNNFKGLREWILYYIPNMYLRSEFEPSRTFRNKFDLLGPLAWALRGQN